MGADFLTSAAGSLEVLGLAEGGLTLLATPAFSPMRPNVLRERDLRLPGITPAPPAGIVPFVEGSAPSIAPFC